MRSKPFLKLVATNILENFSNELENICLIFPSRRAITFFYKYLSELVDKPVWSPTCYTITEFYQKYSSLHIANNLLLNAILYDVFQRVHSTNEDFDHFFPWGNVLLSDFDDIDKYRIDTKILFSQVIAAKKIDELFPFFTAEQIELIERFWHHIHLSKDSREKNQFITIWERLPTVYEQFKNQLRAQEIAYEGMLFRDVADLFDSNSIAVPFSHVGFVGLHALSNCDRVILNYFKDNKKGLFYWDYNPIFADDDVHEAGHFIRKNLKEYPSALENEVFNTPPPKNIEIISVPYQVGQAKLVENIITSLNGQMNEPENTAIVLADETLLLPLIRAIPPTIGEVNVTMGYPVRQTNIYTLFQQIIELQLHGRSSKGFYYKQVEAILYHPFLMKLMQNWVQEFILSFHNSNRVYIEEETFADHEIPLITYIFTSYDSIQTLLDKFIQICNELCSLLFENDDSENNEDDVLIIEKESINSVRTFLNQFQTVIDSVKIPISPTLGMRILMKGLNELRMAFEGEPLRGIQIMGFLETRSLDFENIIILSTNEGFLPRTVSPTSFIPFSLRSAFGLPTLKNRDAIYAYYFYRLLSRSNNVWLLYSTSGDKVMEKSRFIRQLEWDSRYNVRNKNISFSLETVGVKEIRIAKATDILNKIIKIFSSEESYLSPSALSTYLNCSLSFYFRYIAEIVPSEEIKEKIDPAILGSIFHEVMFNTYKPYIGQQLGDITINESIDIIIENCIRKQLQIDESSHLSATAKMIFHIVKRYTEIIINYDKDKCLNHKLIALEQPMFTSLDIANLKIKIGGRVDRIDQKNDGSMIIVDYKTGHVSSSAFKTLSDLFSKENYKKREFLQALIYSWIYYRNTGKFTRAYLYGIHQLAEKGAVTEVRFPNSDLKNEFYSSTQNNVQKTEVDAMGEIEDALKPIITEIINPQVTFEQTSNIEICQWCAYNVICRR
ncbi:MAG: PD-(D/E)XK nuclease family protein [Bacteroidales bacterium]|nr:PD-(D/E)XK nuclease family protein [Bacteroidales bacterium]